MAEYHPGMADWIEAADELRCVLPAEGGQCKWAYFPSGLDTKGDVQASFARHLERHDEQLGKELDAWAASQP